MNGRMYRMTQVPNTKCFFFLSVSSVHKIVSFHAFYEWNRNDAWALFFIHCVLFGFTAASQTHTELMANIFDRKWLNASIVSLSVIEMIFMQTLNLEISLLYNLLINIKLKQLEKKVHCLNV